MTKREIRRYESDRLRNVAQTHKGLTQDVRKLKAKYAEVLEHGVILGIDARLAYVTALARLMRFAGGLSARDQYAAYCFIGNEIDSIDADLNAALATWRAPTIVTPEIVTVPSEVRTHTPTIVHDGEGRH